MKTTESKTTSIIQRHSSQPHFSTQTEQSASAEATFFSPALVQAKLEIGQPNDKYEQEADAKADEVMAKLQDTTPTPITDHNTDLQKATQEEENQDIDVQTKEETTKLQDTTPTPITDHTADLQKATQEEENQDIDVQAKEETTKLQDTTPTPITDHNTDLQKATQEEENQDIDVQAKEETTVQDTPVAPALQQKIALEEETTEEDTLVAAKELESEVVAEKAPPIQTKTETTEITQQGHSSDSNTSAPSAAPLIQTELEAPKEETIEEEQSIQRKGITTATAASLPPPDDDEQPNVQNKSDSAASTSFTLPSFESQLNRTRGSGTPMPNAVHQNMSQAFGSDFSNVRVHTDSSAIQMSQSIGARAFTHGSDIYFNEGEYSPASSEGQHLLAHELTHTVQQGASVQPKENNVVQTSPVPDLQASFMDLLGDVANLLGDIADRVPGYRLFSVLMQRDLIRGTRVELNAENLVDGVMSLVPFGHDIFLELQRRGIIQQAFDWVRAQLQARDLTASRLQRIWNVILGDPVGVARDPVGFVNAQLRPLLNDAIDFARAAIDELIRLIKEALTGALRDLVAENPAYELLTKILHEDPITGEQVNASTVEILEDFLRLIGKETELEEMRKRGTLQKTADWLDTQLATFNSLLGELGGLLTDLLNAVRPENLANIADNLTALASRATGFLERVLTFASTVALQVLQLIKDALLSWLSSVADTVRGFPLVKVIIGKNPFTNQLVERTAPNLIQGFMSLMEGGVEQYNQMEQSGTIANIVGEINAAVDTLNMTPQYVLQLFTDIWNSFTIDDLVNPLAAFERILDQFGAPIARLIEFVIEIVRIVIIAILQIMNFPFDVIENIITRAMAAIESIKRDPIGFIKNLLRAIKQGFIQFFDNIVTHLIGGVTGWLMSELQDAGVPPLTDFSLRGVIGWVLEVLGISMEKIWEKLAAHPRIGPARVARIRSMINTLEGIWTFIKDVQERGMAAIWDKIQEQLSNLWNTVLDAVKNWITEQIVNRVVTRLLSMLDPTGIMAVVNSAIAIYSAIESFVRYMREMLDIINSFVNGVADIAEGNVTTAANYLERTMGQAMPVVIGFLANQVGLSGVGRRVGEMIESVRAMVDQALTWLVNRAVDTGMNLLDRVMGRGNQLPGADSLQNALREVDTEGNQKAADGEVTRADAEQIKTDVNRDHPSVIQITNIRETETTWDFEYVQKMSAQIVKIRLPDENGEWEGTRGNSYWISSLTAVIAWLPGGKIRFTNNYPVFPPNTIKTRVNLGSFIDRSTDFRNADSKLAERWALDDPDVYLYRGAPNAAAVRRWRQENGYTWHHHQNGNQIQLVVSAVHNNIPHIGGISLTT